MDQLMLRPGTSYELTVVALRRERKTGETEWNSDTTRIQRKRYYFKTASAPGLNPEATEPDATKIDFRNSPINRLESYIQRTVPVNGAKVFYPGYDVLVEFNEAYIQALYEGDLSLRVKDRNGKIVMPASYSWLSGVLPLLTPGLLTLLAAPRNRDCAEESKPWQRFLPQHLACSLPVDLSPRRMYQVQVMSAGTVLYSFEFALSRYRNFHEHLSPPRPGDTETTEPYQPTRRRGLPAVTLPALDLAAYDTSRLNFLAAREDLAAVLSVGEGDAGMTLKNALKEMPRVKEAFHEASTAQYALLDQAVQPKFEAIELGHRPLPPYTELVQVSFEDTSDVCFLLESPEPIEWQRIEITRAGGTRPLRVLWNDDQTRAFLLNGDSADGLFAPGPYDLTFNINPGGIMALDLDPLYIEGIAITTPETVSWSVEVDV